MKIKLDTKNKIVEIENSVKISELVETLKGLLGDDYINYELKTVEVINHWSCPIIIDRPYPTYPNYQNPLWFADSTNITGIDCVYYLNVSNQ